MKAVSCTAGRLDVVDLPQPTPGKGQVLLEVSRCGICGSDLHARTHGDELADVLQETGYDGFMRSDQAAIFGHEFSGRVLDYGPDCRRAVPGGAAVVAFPLLRGAGGVHPLGLAAEAPGAYAEQVVVEESLMLPVPNGLPDDAAALTEPLAVAWHAVRRGDVKKKTVAVVIGCGPIGLAVICALKARGVKRVIASDFSSARRALAVACGADVVIDPSSASPYDAAHDRRHLETLPAAVDLLVTTMEKLRRLPVPWRHVLRAADAAGFGPQGPVIFECVGVPGIIDAIIAGAPLFSRIVVVGVCMGPDTLRPSLAINKEIDLRFVVGYSPLEFRDTLHLLAEGRIDASPLVTGTVGLDGVAGAFSELARPDRHAKILIDPRRPGAEIVVGGVGQR